MIDNENELTKTDEEKIVLKDEVYPYVDGENEIVYKDDITYDENMEKAKNVEIVSKRWHLNIFLAISYEF